LLSRSLIAEGEVAWPNGASKMPSTEDKKYVFTWFIVIAGGKPAGLALVEINGWPRVLHKAIPLGC